MMHEILWKVDFVVSSKEIQHQLVINTGLIRASSLLKEAFRHELQKHHVMTIYVHQFG